MSATNQTSNYNLPIFESTDVPSWEGDFNEAMNKIDTAIKGVDDSVDEIGDSIEQISGDVSDLSQDVSGMGGAINEINSRVNTLTNSLNNNYIGITPTYPASVSSLVDGSFKTIYYNRNSVQIMIVCQIKNHNNSVLVNVLGGEPYYAVPLYSVAMNIFDIQQSTLDSEDNKYKLMPLSCSINGSNITPLLCFAYWDGTNTIIACYIRAGVTLNNCVVWGSVTSLNANIIEQ